SDVCSSDLASQKPGAASSGKERSARIVNLLEDLRRGRGAVQVYDDIVLLRIGVCRYACVQVDLSKPSTVEGVAEVIEGLVARRRVRHDSDARLRDAARKVNAAIHLDNLIVPKLTRRIHKNAVAVIEDQVDRSPLVPVDVNRDRSVDKVRQRALRPRGYAVAFINLYAPGVSGGRCHKGTDRNVGGDHGRH